MRLKRGFLAALAAVLLLAGGPGPAAAADDPAVAPVRALYATFETALKDKGSDVRSRVDAVGATFNETFDFPAMVRVAVGPKWKTFTPEQQGALTEAFGKYFIAMYATRLPQAAGGKFDVTPQSEARGATRVVRTRVANAAGEDSQVDYVVNAGNRIQDVLLNGNVSEVASMRTSFADPLKSGPDGLLTFLRERTDGMLAAKPTP